MSIAPRFLSSMTLGVSAALSGCGGAGVPPAAAATMAPSARPTPTAATPDPCTLLAANEAQAYVGTLKTPPFRGDDNGAPNTRGEACVYRGSEARQLVLVRTGEGAAAAGEAAEDVPNVLGSALDKAGAGNLGASTHRVMVQVPAGPWDKATWIPGGTLFVSKADQGVNVDVGGAGGKEEDAIAIARIVVPRLDHPLVYDGAKAAAALPATKAHPENPCQVATQAAVEAAIGTLANPPAANGSSCAYRVASPQGMRIYAIEYVWEGGMQNFNMLKNGNATLGGAMGGTIPTDGLDAMKMDANTSKMVGGLMRMASGGGAPGAATEVGFRTDTHLQGPWDSAMLIHGTQLMAVKADVMVTIDLKNADYDKAKALLSVLCSSL